MAEINRQRVNLPLGVLLFAIAMLLQATVGGLVKEGGPSISVAEFIFVQSVICWILCLPQALRGGFKMIKTSRLGLILTRALTGLVAFFLLYLSFHHIPMVEGMLLMNTAPIWIPIVLLIWKRQNSPIAVWLAVILGFIGVACVIGRPTNLVNLYAPLALVSGIGLAIVIICLRDLTKTETSEKILFYYFLLLSLATLGPVLEQWAHGVTHISVTGWTCMVVSGFVMYGCQMTLNHGMRFGTPHVLGPLIYLSPVFSGIIDWIFWHHVPHVMTFVGTALVIIAGILSIRLGSPKPAKV